MKELAFMIVFIGLSAANLHAQNWVTDFSRTDLDPLLSPFYHGVASGDPTSKEVIIWTRVTPDTSVSGSIVVTWKIATDTNISNVINSGSTTTSDTVDYTVKVDVDGLSADTWYYYEFNALGKNSLIGRTKTAPLGDNSNVRFAVVSCSGYEAGYFNAYERVAYRNDVDAVLHLGDYIYEYSAGGGSIAGRDHEPANEILDLTDYRTRLSHYHLDHDLRQIHQFYPFIMIWDDHETANNSWTGGAQNHDPGTEGLWQDRKSAAIQAYFEWLPVRQPDPTGNPERIYRKLGYGNLVDLYMLDTRLEGRDEQVGTTSSQLQDSSRTLLGPAQYNWLVNGMDSSFAQWQVIGQQVMVTPLEALGVPVNDDQWDGYPIERQLFFNDVVSKNINDVVILTGDIHTSWANDLPFHPSTTYVPSTGEGSVGVEFVVTSITSSSGSIPLAPSTIISFNPHIKYVDLIQKGYMILDVSKTRVQADWYYVPTVTSVDHSDAYGTGWYTNAQDGFLQAASSATVNQAITAFKPPALPHNGPVGIENNAKPASVLFGVYPNPYADQLYIKYYLFEQAPVTLKVVDLLGKTVHTKKLGSVNKGINYADLNGIGLAKGSYIILLETPGQTLKRKVIKN